MSVDATPFQPTLVAPRSVLTRSITRFERFLDTDAAGAGLGERPLLVAFRLLTTRLGISNAVDPGGNAAGNLADELDRLANANGLLIRETAIGSWSRAGEGPFIVERLAGTPQARPVALMRRGKTWVIFDPTAMEKPQPLDAATMAELAQRAYRLCRAFPAKPMRKRDLLLFANQEIRLNLVEFLGVSLLTGIAASLLALATGFVSSTVIPGREFTLLYEVIVMMVLVLAGNAGTRLVSGLTQLRMDGRMGTILRTAAIDRLVRSRSPLVRGMPPPIQMMCARSIEGFHRTIRGIGLSLVSAGAVALPSLVIMASISGGTAAIVLGVIVIASAVTAMISLREMKAMQMGPGGPMGWMSTSYEALAQVDTVRSSNAEAFMFSRWADGFLTMQQRMLRAEMIGATAQGLQHALQVLLLLSTILALLVTGQLSGGNVSITFVMASMTVAGAATALVGSFSSLGMIGMQAKMIAPLLADVPPGRSLTPVLRLKGAVAATDIWARREPGGPFVLRNVNFDLQPGRHVGICGPSGSGKSTLMQVLLGLLEPEQGVVAYDGVDLRKLDAAGIRRQVALAGQGSKLFAGSIRDNVKAGLDLTDDEIWQALAITQVADEVRRFGLGLSTIINDSDPTLSGGQAQRILLARAIAARPTIVVLDEATSAIDPPTRERITRALDQLGIGIIAIAHRLDTLVKADCIYVLDNGEITEKGRFDELMARNGTFARLYELETDIRAG
jgi:ABC-type bacteriocin/lantibiotic exporter with double-glycine peptidase domain